MESPSPGDSVLPSGGGGIVGLTPPTHMVLKRKARRRFLCGASGTVGTSPFFDPTHRPATCTTLLNPPAITLRPNCGRQSTVSQDLALGLEQSFKRKHPPIATPHDILNRLFRLQECLSPGIGPIFQNPSLDPPGSLSEPLLWATMGGYGRQWAAIDNSYHLRIFRSRHFPYSLISTSVSTIRAIQNSY